MAIMKLRRRSKFPDLRGMPLDGVDMFLLSRLEGELTLNQLVDLVPVCEPQETELRVYQLARLGLIEGPPVRAALRPEVAEPVTSPAPPPAHLLSVSAEDAIAVSDDDELEMVTAPPPPRDAVTAPPPPLADMVTAPPGPLEVVTAPPPPLELCLDAMNSAPPAVDHEDMVTLPPPPNSKVHALIAASEVDTDQTARVRARPRP